MKNMEFSVKTAWLPTIAIILLGSTVFAEPWPVSGKLLKNGDKKADDISGIACESSEILPRSCLVIDDETQWAQWVSLKEGEIVAGSIVPLINDQFEDEPLELDGEGVAFSEGSFYVVGSHGLPRTSRQMSSKKSIARLNAASKILRVSLNGAVSGSSESLAQVISQHPKLRDHAGRPLDQNGVSIEGTTVVGNKSFFGFRTPIFSVDGDVEPDRAAVLEVRTDSLFGGEADPGTLHMLPLGSLRGVRDLTTVGDQVLILAGPGPDVDGAFAIFRWRPGEMSDVRFVGELPCNEPLPGKAEALLPLGLVGSQLRVLVMFDGPNEGAPLDCTFAWEPE